jgi:hypothetical protein
MSKKGMMPLDLREARDDRVDVGEEGVDGLRVGGVVRGRALRDLRDRRRVRDRRRDRDR